MFTTFLIAFCVALVSVGWNKNALPKLQFFALIVFVLFPAVASAAFQGAKFGETVFHIPSVVGFVVAVISLSRSRENWSSQSFRVGLGILALGIGIGLVFTYGSTGRAGLIALFNCLIAPICLAISIATSLHSDRNSKRLLGNLVTWAACLESVLSIVQFASRSNLIYTQQLVNYQPFYNITTYSRAQGTFDHPLILACFLVLGLCVVSVSNPFWLKWPVVALLLTGIVLSQSRTALILAFAVILTGFLISRGRRISISLMLSAILGFILWNLPVVQDGISSLMGKIGNDYGSTQARLDSFGYFTNHIYTFLFGANGFTSSFDLKNASVLNSSLENGILMWLYDLGIISLLFIILGYTIAVKQQNSYKDFVAPLSVTVMVISFSSIASSPVTSLIWFLSFTLFISNPGLESNDSESRELSVTRNRKLRFLN